MSAFGANSKGRARTASVALALLASLGAVPFMASPAMAGARTAALANRPASAISEAPTSALANPATADPPTNVARTRAMDQACGQDNPATCQAAVVQGIDQARTAEGVGPLALPPGYDDLSARGQLLVLTDLERVDRGLPGFTGLSANLDDLAQSGADTNNDPTGPAGRTWGSNWAGGEASALLADYDWMYDDGPGSPNLDCSSPTATSCWDHRLNILGDYGQHPAMGAAAAKVDGVTSLTQLIASGPPQATT
jgi:hypothetical protein